MNVVRLATSQNRPRRLACSDCRFYHPDLTDMRGHRRWAWTLQPPFVRTWKEPDATSYKFAVCSAFGGVLATSERAKYGRCGEEARAFDTALTEPEGGR